MHFKRIKWEKVVVRKKEKQKKLATLTHTTHSLSHCTLTQHRIIRIKKTCVIRIITLKRLIKLNYWNIFADIMASVRASKCDAAHDVIVILKVFLVTFVLFGERIFRVGVWVWVLAERISFPDIARRTSIKFRAKLYHRERVYHSDQLPRLNLGFIDNRASYNF